MASRDRKERGLTTTEPVTGSPTGATRPDDFPRQANGCGQASGAHASSRTGPDHAERLTGIYGSVSVGGSSPSERATVSPGQRLTCSRPKRHHPHLAAFGRISVSGSLVSGSLVETVRIAVHLAWVQVPVQSSVVVMLAWPMISWSIFGGYPAWIISAAAVCRKS